MLQHNSENKILSLLFLLEYHICFTFACFENNIVTPEK